MIKKLSTNELQAKLDDEGVFYKLVDVAGPKEFKKGHIPNAINISLDTHFDSKAQKLLTDKDQEVIVYTSDGNAPSAIKAAERLEHLGYQDVFCYEGGKAKWKKLKLPLEGERKAYSTFNSSVLQK